MSELPQGWTEASLDEIGIASTTTIDPSRHSNEVFDLFSVPSFSNGMADTIPGNEIGSTKQQVEPGDVLLCKIVPHINRVWVVPSKGEKRQIASSEWIVVRNGGFEPGFLRYCLSGPDFREDFLRDLTGVGGSLTRARPQTVRKIRVPVAPLAEQRLIVAKLNSLLERANTARDQLIRIPLLIEHYKQTILEKAFIGELTADWRDTHPKVRPVQEFRRSRSAWAAGRTHTRGLSRDERTAITDRDADLQRSLTERAELQELPDTWEWCGLGEVFGVYVGATPSRKNPSFWGGHVPWVSSGEVAFCRIADTEEKITAAGLSNASTRLHPPGTVLLGMIGEGKTRGQAAILDVEACNNQNCAAIRVSEASYPPEYVYWYLLSVYKQTRTAGAGNNQPALNKDKVQRLPIPLAPPDEAFAVVEALKVRLGPLQRIEDEHLSAVKQLGRLEPRLLAKAFRGELVPQNPNDEPADVLLERIRAERGAAPAKRGRGRRKAG